MRAGWVLFWCVQSYAWAWDAPAAYQADGQELAPDPYAPPVALAPDPYALTRDTAPLPLEVNHRSRRAHADAQLAPSPYEGMAKASLAPMPYAGAMGAREVARPSAQPLALAASPYDRSSTPDLAPDPY